MFVEEDRFRFRLGRGDIVVVVVAVVVVPGPPPPKLSYWTAMVGNGAGSRKQTVSSIRHYYRRLITLCCLKDAVYLGYTMRFSRAGFQTQG